VKAQGGPVLITAQFFLDRYTRK